MQFITMLTNILPIFTIVLVMPLVGVRGYGIPRIISPPANTIMRVGDNVKGTVRPNTKAAILLCNSPIDICDTSDRAYHF